MRGLITFLLALAAPLPALATCPATPNDCPAGPIYKTVQSVFGVIGGPWTTATRPTNPVIGATGFNSTLMTTETWTGTGWQGGGGSGSVPSFSPASHQFVTGFTLGAWQSGQPSFADIAGLGGMAQQSPAAVAITGATLLTGLPTPVNPSDAATKAYADSVGIGSMPSLSPATHLFVTGFTGGAWRSGQPAYADITGLGGMATQSPGAVAITGATLLTGLPAPVNPTDAATKGYADAITSSLGTAAFAATNISGHAVPYLDALGNTWGGDTAAGGVQLILNSLINTQRSIRFNTASSSRWRLQSNQDPEVGLGAGASMWLVAYNDAGVLNGQVFQASRTSGPMGLGVPYFDQLNPWDMLKSRSTSLGGVLGWQMNLGNTSDAQPVSTLGANPLAVTSGSPTVTVTWPNCCGASSGRGSAPGPLYNAFGDTWVLLSGVTATGGITPAGWLRVQSIPTVNTFTVTWTASATSTVAGGGSVVTAQPSFATQATKTWVTMTAGSGGYPVAHTDYYIANPAYYLPLTSPAVNYFRDFSQTYSPNDQTKSHAYSTVSHEMDVINRGADVGYSPNLYGTVNPTMGLWMGPLPGPVISAIAGGGTGQNWNTMMSCFSGGSYGGVQVGIYDCLSNQANSLVGAANDPNGHGGVGFDSFGAQDFLANPPFTTTAGSNVVTVSMLAAGGLRSQTNGNMVYFFAPYTVNGVSFGPGSYALTCVGACVSATQFTFTGTGTGTAGSGGGVGIPIAFATLVPHSPVLVRGEFKHGFGSTPDSRFDDGFIVAAQTGQGIGWNDGTAAASITGIELSAGNIDILLTPRGTGKVRLTGGAVVTGGLTVDSCSGCGGGGSSFANPTGTAGPAGVNGVATTAMRSDASPPVQLMTSTQKGIGQVDGQSIVANAGVISVGAPLRSAAAPTVLTTDMSGTVLNTGGAFTIPPIGPGLFDAKQTVFLVNYSGATEAVTTPLAISALGNCIKANGIPPGYAWQVQSNNTSLECLQVVSAPGAGAGPTVTDGTTAVSGATTIAFGSGFKVTGSGGLPTVNQSYPVAAAKTASFTVGAAEMNTLTPLNISGGGVVTLSATGFGTTVFGSGASVCLQNISASSNNMVTDSTGATIYPSLLSIIPAGIPPGSTFCLQSDGVRLYASLTGLPSGASAAAQPWSIGGLTLSNDATTPNTMIDIDAGAATSDDLSTSMVIGAFTKTTAAWAAGSGNGCLDTGTVANNTWYFVFLISNTSTGTVGVLCSTSAAPAFPSGYTKKHWIGSILTNGSAAILPFRQRGPVVYLTAPIYFTASLTSTASLVTMSVPPGARVKPLWRASINGTGVACLFTSPDEADLLPTVATPMTASPGFDVLDNSLTVGVQNAIGPDLITNGASQIRARCTGAATLGGVLRGWSY